MEKAIIIINGRGGEPGCRRAVHLYLAVRYPDLYLGCARAIATPPPRSMPFPPPPTSCIPVRGGEDERGYRPFAHDGVDQNDREPCEKPGVDGKRRRSAHAISVTLFILV